MRRPSGRKTGGGELCGLSLPPLPPFSSHGAPRKPRRRMDNMASGPASASDPPLSHRVGRVGVGTRISVGGRAPRAAVECPPILHRPSGRRVAAVEPGEHLPNSSPTLRGCDPWVECVGGPQGPVHTLWEHRCGDPALSCRRRVRSGAVGGEKIRPRYTRYHTRKKYGNLSSDFIISPWRRGVARGLCAAAGVAHGVRIHPPVHPACPPTIPFR